MKCRSAKKLVFEFIDGLDDDSKRLELEKHLAGCPECDRFASSLTRSLDLLHRAPAEKTGEDFAWNVRMRINRERNTARAQPYGSSFRLWNLRYAATAAGAFAVVLVAGMIAMKSGLVPQPPVRQVESPAVADATTEPLVGPPELVDFNDYLGRVGEGTAVERSSNGTGVIDAPAILSPAELDSLVGAEMQGLAPEQRIRYMQEFARYLQVRYRTEDLKIRNR